MSNCDLKLRCRCLRKWNEMVRFDDADDDVEVAAEFEVGDKFVMCAGCVKVEQS